MTIASGRLLALLVLIASTIVPAVAQQKPRESPAWEKLPRMKLERQFAGPLQDTIIQRWRDPVDGTICYIYLPITAAHSAPTASGFAQYGANTIGSVSCFAASAKAAAVKGRIKRAR